MARGHREQELTIVFFHRRLFLFLPLSTFPTIFILNFAPFPEKKKRFFLSLPPLPSPFASREMGMEKMEEKKNQIIINQKTFLKVSTKLLG